MSAHQKIFNSLIVIAVVVSITTGGFYLSDSLNAKNNSQHVTTNAAGSNSGQNTLPEVVTGAPGATGKDGAAGTSGADGSSGASGAKGANGSKGSMGVAGASGAQGANGAAGATGETGNPGTNGSTGASGSIGASGGAGAAGAQGSAGTPGATGAQGAAGADGAQGSAGSGGGLLSTSIPEKLELDLKNQVFGLTTGSYVLPMGSEGQQVYFFAANGAELGSITILVENLRMLNESTVIIEKTRTWVPFDAKLPSVTMVSAIYAQGSWTLLGGSVQ